LPLPTPQKPSKPKGPVAALLLSHDFFLGLALGFGLSALPALIPALIVNGFSFFITLSGVAAAVAALVLAPMSMLLAAITPALARLLKNLPGGIEGVFRPFKQVAFLAVLACVTSLVVAVLSPLGSGTFPIIVWLVAGVPIFLMLWSLFGFIQVTGILVDLVKKGLKAQELDERRAAALETSERRSS
jgi:hypothetical protein